MKSSSLVTPSKSIPHGHVYKKTVHAARHFYKYGCSLFTSNFKRAQISKQMSNDAQVPWYQWLNQKPQSVTATVLMTFSLGPLLYSVRTSSQYKEPTCFQQPAEHEPSRVSYSQVQTWLFLTRCYHSLFSTTNATRLGSFFSLDEGKLAWAHYFVFFAFLFFVKLESACTMPNSRRCSAIKASYFWKSVETDSVTGTTGWTFVRPMVCLATTQVCLRIPDMVTENQTEPSGCQIFRDGQDCFLVLSSKALTPIVRKDSNLFIRETTERAQTS